METARGPTTSRLLRESRQRHSWSQAYVAAQIGADPLTISRWERGITTPSMHFQRQLCALFGVTAEQFGFGPQASADSNCALPADEPLVIATPPSPPPAHGLVGRGPLLEQCTARLCTMAKPIQVAFSDCQVSG